MAWPKTTGFPPLALTKHRIGPLAVAVKGKVQPAPPWLERVAFGPAATTAGEEEAHVWSRVPPRYIQARVLKPNAASVEASAPAPKIKLTGSFFAKPPAATVNVSAPSPAAFDEIKIRPPTASTLGETKILELSILPRAPTTIASAPEARISISASLPAASAAAVAASALPPKVFTGPSLSPTDRKIGTPLALPYPTVLADPERLGPPRLTAAEREMLGLTR